VSSYVKGEDEAGEHDQEDGEELGRVGESPPERHHIQPEHFQLLDVEREEQESAQNSYRAVGRLNSVACRDQGHH